VLPEGDSPSLQHFPELVDTQRLSPLIVAHTYHAPEVARHARPGQFVHIRVSEGTAPLLRRPLSILDVDRARGNFRILFKIVGVGTRLLADKSRGDRLDLLGPLGSTFPDLSAHRTMAFVAGGIGMVPLYFQARELAEAAAPGAAPAIDYWFGARSHEEIYLLDDLRRYCRRVEPVTDDGSLGQQGRVTALAEPHLAGVDAVLSCGPNAMLADLQRRMAGAPALAGITALAAMESFMGCGLGACLGCVITTTSGYERVCTEGPVFELHRLVFA
jgi:dihydroorotate dehydrogenase electron transfer subunit